MSLESHLDLTKPSEKAMNREHPLALQLSTDKELRRIRFEERDLFRRGPVGVKVPFHPLGISYDPRTEQLVIACYFEPQVCLGKLRQDDGDLVMDLAFVKGAVGTCRLFRGFFKDDHNRAQFAFMGEDGKLCVGRNGDHNISAISPPLGNKRWEFAYDIVIPTPGGVDTGAMVHSLLSVGHELLTIESDVKCLDWTLNRYTLGIPDSPDPFCRTGDPEPIGAFRYGIAMRPDDERLWTITDFRTKERPGVYAGDERIIPGLCGNGIVFLPGGDAIVTQYGHSIGQDGTLVFVPAHMFEK